MGLSGDSRAEGTSSPVELGPARQSQLFLPRLRCLRHFSPLLIPLCLVIGLSFHLVVDISGGFLLCPNAYFCETFRNLIRWRSWFSFQLRLTSHQVLKRYRVRRAGCQIAGPINLCKHSGVTSRGAAGAALPAERARKAGAALVPRSGSGNCPCPQGWWPGNEPLLARISVPPQLQPGSL